jgi:hypothetical protein
MQSLYNVFLAMKGLEFPKKLIILTQGYATEIKLQNENTNQKLRASYHRRTKGPYTLVT